MLLMLHAACMCVRVCVLRFPVPYYFTLAKMYMCEPSSFSLYAQVTSIDNRGVSVPLAGWVLAALLVTSGALAGISADGGGAAATIYLGAAWTCIGLALLMLGRIVMARTICRAAMSSYVLVDEKN